MLAPLPPSFSPLLIKKMEIVLEELGINDDQIVCSEDVQRKYEELKLLIVKMLCIEKMNQLKVEQREALELKDKDV